ncbi:hypothetical protein CCP4SC76_4600001 [Gammaproteobacteria bacterium]
MDKRSSTISSRIPPDLEKQLHAIAIARDISLSDLVYTALASLAREEHIRYLKLKQAFDGMPDIQDLLSE